MAKDKEVKTNAMRQLDRAKISYVARYYDHDPRDEFSGVIIAEEMHDDASICYKTLVTEGKSGNHYVFVLPVAEELDMKKAAKAVGEKSIAMVPVKDIEKITGYIRGGCSPVGMKKQFKTVIDQAAEPLDYFHISGGKMGTQLECKPTDIAQLIRASFQDILQNDKEDAS